MKRDFAGSRSTERSAEVVVIGGEKRIDPAELTEECVRCRVCSGLVAEQGADFTPIDRMSGLDAHSADGEARQFRARHQLKGGIMMAACDGAECRSQADEVAERAWKNHERAHCR